METVSHLWNVNQYLTKLKCPLAMELQTFYMQSCRNLGDEVALPTQNFGPSKMCSHCGSLWSTIDHQVRLLPGRKMSKAVKKIVKDMNENNQEVPRACATLAQKSVKNEMNKLVIKCSVCLKNTELPFVKKNRLKPVKLNTSNIETPQSNRKKKKKKTKDKTAGLNISGYLPELQQNKNNKENDNKTPTKLPTNSSKMNSNRKLVTSVEKSKKLNVERLKHIISCTPSKRNSLQNFLKNL